MKSNEQIYQDAKTRVMFLLGQAQRGKVEQELEFALRAEGVTRARVSILAGNPGRLEIFAPGQEKLLCGAMRFWCMPFVAVAATPENLVEFLARARGWRPYQGLRK